jgi:hypothetical protein
MTFRFDSLDASHSFPDEEYSARARTPMSAWVLLFLYGLMLALVSVFWLLHGHLFDHRLYEVVGGSSWSVMEALDADVVELVSSLVRLGGALGLVASVFIMAVALAAYRNGERWAWYVMWALPLGSTLDLSILAAYGALSPTSIVWDVYMLALALAGLVIPYRAFFSPPEPEPIGDERELTGEEPSARSARR